METPEPRENRTEKIREQIRHLTALLEDYSDEIPSEMKSGGQGNYKVGAGWLREVLDATDLVELEIGISDPSIHRDMTSFAESLSKRRQEWRDAVSAGTAQGDFLRTTREEIDTANSLLRRLIENLQNSI